MAEWLHEKGRAEGRAEGRVEGLAEGEAKGALSTSREMLRHFLEHRFGPLPEGVRQRIDSNTDLERLKACVCQAPTVTSLDELQL